jgi:hypothetical protein
MPHGNPQAQLPLPLLSLAALLLPFTTFRSSFLVRRAQLPVDGLSSRRQTPLIIQGAGGAAYGPVVRPDSTGT